MYGAGSPIAGAGDGSEEHASLVEQIKQIGRGDPTAKQQWCAYCMQGGGGKFDPKHHSADFLKNFIAQHTAGIPMPLSAPEADIPFGEFTKALQKKSKGFKRAYENYCNLVGGGRFDPMKHDDKFLLGFYEHLATASMMQSGQGFPMMEMPPAKRMRTGPAPGSMGAAPGSKEQLVDAIKAFCRQSIQNRDMWATYTDTFGAGTRDPSRHEQTLLQDFCSQYQLDVTSLAKPPAGNLAAAFGAAVVSPPARGAAPLLHPAGAKQVWVEKLKAFQRSSHQNKELWNLYCDTYLGGARDPSRHEVSVLQEFCANHSVDAAIQSAGLAVPSKPSWPPGAAWGGAGGDADPYKEQLVQAVKAFQRSSEVNYEMWSQFADAQPGAARDPYKYDVARLQEFCYANGVDMSSAAAATPRGGAGGPWSSQANDPAKAALVQKIKDFQRTGPEQKEVWAVFAGQTLDPNRHTMEELSEFVSAHVFG